MPSNYLILCHTLILPSIFPSSRVFSNGSALHIRWPKSWSFSFNISSSNEYSGLISFQRRQWHPTPVLLPGNSHGWRSLLGFRMDWFDLLAAQGTSAPQFESINSSAFSLLYGPTLTSIHDYWKNHSFDQMDLCRQSDVSAF